MKLSEVDSKLRSLFVLFDGGKIPQICLLFSSELDKHEFQFKILSIVIKLLHHKNLNTVTG